jgi:hypothetical protein
MIMIAPIQRHPICPSHDNTCMFCVWVAEATSDMGGRSSYNDTHPNHDADLSSREIVV